MTNKIIDNAGLIDTPDPRAIQPVNDAASQGAISARMADEARRSVINYETLPLYCENILLALLQSLFEQDPTFPYVHGDPVASRIALTVNWSRSAMVNRDQRPLIVVAFQDAGVEELVMRNQFSANNINQLREDHLGVSDVSRFRISVIHHNRTLTLFLAQQVRACIAGAMDILRTTFNLAKVYPPSLSGPGNLDEYPDLFMAAIDLRIMALPAWRQTTNAEIIRKITVSAIVNAQESLQNAVTNQLIVT